MGKKASESSDGSTAYINGRVYTVDSQNPWAEAFIVSPRGKFTAVGSTAEITAKAHKDHLVIFDLRGEFIMPGIHDAHVHMLMSGIAMTSQARLPAQSLTNANVAEELKKGSCLCRYSHVHQDWLIGNGYLVEDFHRDHLDKDFPETPVMIRGGAGHSAFLNSEAMRRSGYDVRSEADGQGTRYLRDADGGLTGEMAEMSMSKVLTSYPKPDAHHVKRVLKEAQTMLHAAGVTSCQEASANTLMLNGLRAMEADGSLKLEMFTHIVYAPDWIGEEKTESLHALIERAESLKSKHVDTGFVKIILDGVPLAPYYSQAGFQPDGSIEEAKLFVLNVSEAIQKYDEKDMTMKIHCTGRGATRLVLNAYAEARKRNPRGPRHEIAHCSGVLDEDYARFKDLNITAEMSPAFLFAHPLTAASNGLMDWNFPKMLRAGAHITIGSDWGAGEAPDLLPCLAAVVESVGDGDRRLGGQRLVRMLTLGGAQAVGRDEELGSIEVGKKANFIAISRDLSAGDFEGAQVLKTWFEGEMVYVCQP